MRTRRLLAMLLAVATVICMIPFTAMAADPAVMELDGERTVFVSNFGKMAYNGKSYASFRNIQDAFNALGAEGGRIIFTGNMSLGNFDGISNHGKIHLQGIGTKATGNTLNFCGTADAPIKEVSLKGDLVLDFLTIRFDEGAVLLTNGYELETINEFDTYSTLKYVSGGSDIKTYVNPPSVAPGATTKEVSSIILEAGTYTSVIVGAATAQNLKGDSFIRLNGGKYENVVVGNTTSASIDGDAMLYVAKGKIENLVAGPVAGTVNGNVSVQIAGGEIANTVVGAQAGATVNGNVTVIIGGKLENKITAGAGKVTGKKIIITGADNPVSVDAGAADYFIKVQGGICEPQFDGINMNGFLVTDTNGIPAKSITVNGKTQTDENGIYALSAGTLNVTVTSAIAPAINKNSNYVAGYTDGTFKPQNNMTKAEAVTLLARTIIDENLIKEVKTTFKDTEAGAWYVPYIGFFEKLGYLDLVADDSGTRFAPNENITRAQFVQMVYKIMCGNTTSKSSKLVSVVDVDSNNPYKTAIYYAMSNGIVTGYPDGTFKPDASITRAEVVTIVNRMLGRTPTGNAGSNTFSDTAAHWANGQILAACNPEGVSWTPAVTNSEFVLTGTSAADYVPALYEQAKNLSADAIQRGADAITEQMKKDIMNTPNTEEIYSDKMTGQKYYVSEKNGNDDNDGKTPETACKTISGIYAKLKFPKAGTSILFERGGVYRGTISAGYNGFIIGSYGTGPKPIIMQSKKNYADESLWVETEWENVWKCTDRLGNVGVIGFDHDIQDYSAASYEETYGIIVNANLPAAESLEPVDGFTDYAKTYTAKGVQDLKADLQFYSVLDNDQTTGGTVGKNELYLYSTKGNPGKRFKSIEIGENVAIVSGKGNDVVIDNISFKFTGGHAMGGAGGCKNRTVTNCIFSWLGGSVLSLDFHGSGKPVNYGNAVEIYGTCNGYRVENNWMYQIYDTGVTHQYSDKSACTMENIQYYKNLIEYCHWGIEYYNADDGSVPSDRKYIKDVHMAYNVVNQTGYGWGSITRFRQRGSYAHCGYSLANKNENELTEYNLYNRGAGYIVYLTANSKEVFQKNIYIQTVGNRLGLLRGTYRDCDYNAAEYFAKDLGDNTSIVVVTEE